MKNFNQKASLLATRHNFDSWIDNKRFQNDLNQPMNNNPVSVWLDGGDNIDYFDINTANGPGDYLGGKLVAIQPVTILNTKYLPKKIVQPGATVGTIDSFTLRNGMVYWLLTTGDLVKHETGIFDKSVLELSLNTIETANKSAVNVAAQKRMDANKNPLYVAGKKGLSVVTDFVGNLEGTLKGVAVVAVVLIVLYAISVLKSK